MSGILKLSKPRLVQLASPCDGKELVVNVHAVFLGLVAGVHVEASPEAMIPPAVFHVVAVLSGHGQSAGAASVCLSGGSVVRREGGNPPSRRHRDHWSDNRLETCID